ncbi:MAG: hypothetical protein VW455_00570 [Nitrospinota bacterium]
MGKRIDPDESKVDVDKKDISIIKRIELAKNKEIDRLKDEQEKSERIKHSNEKLLAEKFSKLKFALNELKRTYSENKGIHVKVHEFSAYLSFGESLENMQGEMFIEPDASGEGFSISGNILGHNSLNFNSSEEVIDFIVDFVGKFLAKRDWREGI